MLYACYRDDLRLTLLRSVAVLVTLLGCYDALAAPTALDRERARALMDVGDSRFEAGAYEAALEQYRAADAIMNVPTTGIEVGRTLEKLGRVLQARDVLKRVALLPVTSDEPKAFAAARQEAQRLAAELTARIPHLRIVVAGLSQGTLPELSIDGRLRSDVTPGSDIEVDPGAHRVTARAPGRSDAVADVAVAEKQLKEVTLTLSERPVIRAAVAPTSSQTAVPVAPRDQAGSTGSGRRVLLWSSVGVAAAGFAVGTVTGLKSLSLTQNVKDDCEGNACPARRGDDIAQAKTLANVSNIAFGVGVAALGASAWQWWTLSKGRRPAPDRASLDLAVAPTSVRLQGAF